MDEKNMFSSVSKEIKRGQNLREQKRAEKADRTVM